MDLRKEFETVLNSDDLDGFFSLRHKENERFESFEKHQNDCIDKIEGLKSSLLEAKIDLNSICLFNKDERAFIRAERALNIAIDALRDLSRYTEMDLSFDRMRKFKRQEERYKEFMKLHHEKCDAHKTNIGG